MAQSKSQDWTNTEGLVFHEPLAGRHSAVKVAGCEEKKAPCDLTVIDGPAGKAREFDGRQFLESDSATVNLNYVDPFTLAAGSNRSPGRAPSCRTQMITSKARGMASISSMERFGCTSFSGGRISGYASRPGTRSH